jgi:hypothetical protein
VNRNKLNLSKGFVLLAIAVFSFTESALAQSPAKSTGAAKATPVYSKVNALASAPVTVYPKVDDGYSLVTWNTLSHFAEDTPDIDEEIDPNVRRKRDKKYPIPAFITALNKVPVAIVGFMIPMDVDNKGEKTTGFILARSQATCCYGIMPKLNEWIYVTMEKDRAADIVMDLPITVFGVLEVGERNLPDEGWSLYRMIGKKLGNARASTW